MDTNTDSNFIGILSEFYSSFTGSLRDQRTELDSNPSGADSLHVSGCTLQLEFDTATSIATI